MQNNIDFDKEHFCPICQEVIEPDVCYELVMCMFGGLKTESVPEVRIKKTEENKKICNSCPYSDLS